MRELKTGFNAQEIMSWLDAGKEKRQEAGDQVREAVPTKDHTHNEGRAHLFSSLWHS